MEFRGQYTYFSKIVVLDAGNTACGSQNANDPELRIKACHAPRVDLVPRIEGPVAVQNRHLLLAGRKCQP